MKETNPWCRWKPGRETCCNKPTSTIFFLNSRLVLFSWVYLSKLIFSCTLPILNNSEWIAECYIFKPRWSLSFWLTYFFLLFRTGTHFLQLNLCSHNSSPSLDYMAIKEFLETKQAPPGFTTVLLLYMTHCIHLFLPSQFLIKIVIGLCIFMYSVSRGVGWFGFNWLQLETLLWHKARLWMSFHCRQLVYMQPLLKLKKISQLFATCLLSRISVPP